MAKTKTMDDIERQLAEAQQRVERLKKERAAKDKALKEIERKERTRRLIQLGGIIEKYCGKIDNVEAFESYINQWSNAINKAVKADTRPTETASADDGGSAVGEYF